MADKGLASVLVAFATVLALGGFADPGVEAGGHDDASAPAVKTDAAATTDAAQSAPSTVDRCDGQSDGQSDGQKAVTAGPASRIGRIDLRVGNVFDTDIPGENRYLYRLANLLHFTTRPATIEKQLLIREGDAYSPRLVAESERILRRAPYLYDAQLCVESVVGNDVNIAVKTKDVWSFEPAISFSRKGGKNTGSVEITERNLLGRGTQLHVGQTFDVDRHSTTFGFSSDYLTRRHLALNIGYADSTDGSALRFAIAKPFRALDTRSAWALSAGRHDLVQPFYDAGEVVERFARNSKRVRVHRGFSRGLSNGSVKRWTAGVAFASDSFAVAELTADPTRLPEERRFVYPFVGFNFFQDKFRKTRNQDLIGRSEDVLLGHSISAELGFAAAAFGSNEDALLISARHGFGVEPGRATRVLVSTGIAGRVVGGGLENASVGLGARYFYRFSDNWTTYAAFDSFVGRRLDVDRQVLLGGDSGLRGYPLRYQGGNKRVLATVEQRYYTNWYPFRLFRVGAAAFVDVGRTWGENAFVADPRQQWLGNAGFGLRLANTRSSSGNIVHIDVAFPFETAQIDRVQFLVTTRQRF